MLKVTVLYGHPDDAAAFEAHYNDRHLPLAAKMPHVQRFEASKVVGTPDGSEPPYYRLAELWFESQEDLQMAMGSDEGRATVEDIGAFASGGATVIVSAVD
jgi:uncharacterized protein (TIGR02118 family)